MLTAGVLAGWKRRKADHFTILTLQILDAAQGAGEDGTPNYARVSVAMGDEQLCSLARDLARAAQERGLDVWKRGQRSILDRLMDRLRGHRVIPEPSGELPPMLALVDTRGERRTTD